MKTVHKSNAQVDKFELLNTHLDCQSVFAVVVSYHPDFNVIRNLLYVLLPCVGKVCIVDNGSGQSFVSQLSEIINSHNIELISLPCNYGIASAQNIGIKSGAEQGYKYVLLLDQDSLPETNMVRSLLRAHLSLISNGIHTAAVGPVLVDRRTGVLGGGVLLQAGRLNRVMNNETKTADLVELDFIISSGTLIPLHILTELGGMNESFFIDHVDTEWCLRARMRGWKIFGVHSAKLGHTLGDNIIRIWFFRWREVAIHSPLRNYYMTRNAVLMLRFTHMTLSWRIAILTRAFASIFFFGTVLPLRRQRIMMMAKGFWHGIIGRTGAFS